VYDGKNSASPSNMPVKNVKGLRIEIGCPEEDVIPTAKQPKEGQTGIG
jgi:hypothetical protein